jgi:hypothetical protein
MSRAPRNWGLLIATALMVLACGSPTPPTPSQPSAGERSRGASTPTTTTSQPPTTAPSTGPSPPSSVTPRLLERAPDGCTYTREYWPPAAGYVVTKVAMPERPGQADDEQPAADHLEAYDQFTAYADIDCSGITYVMIVPYKRGEGNVGLVRKTDAIRVRQAPPATI